MEIKTEKLCGYCDDYCPLREKLSEVKNCIFNLIIFENENKILFYNLPEKRIFKIENGKGLDEIDFKDAIREIDIIPEKNPEWKRAQILYLARELGLFGLNI